VQQTFERLWPTAQTAKLFYAKLFEIAPHIQSMFRNVPEMEEQGDKFKRRSERHRQVRLCC